jgi:hypothetical protein
MDEEIEYDPEEKAAHVKELAKARQKLYTTRKSKTEFAKTAANTQSETGKADKTPSKKRKR